MKNKNGITLMALVITIIILLMLSAVSINVGINSYEMMQSQKFISELKLIQSKVDNLSEENEDISAYGFLPLADISEENKNTYDLFLDIIQNPVNYNIDTSNSWNDELDRNVNNYYYFSEKEFEKLGLKEEEMIVIINFKTRNVISKTGVKREGKKYYRQYDLTDGDTLINK